MCTEIVIFNLNNINMLYILLSTNLFRIKKIKIAKLPISSYIYLHESI